jgi:hypothetical protein
LSSAGFIFYSIPELRTGLFGGTCSNPCNVGRPTGEQTLHLTLTQAYQYSQYVTLRY